MKFFAENNFDVLREKFDAHLSDATLNAKLENLFTPKPYSLRWRGANWAALALSGICNIVSAITAFALFSFVLYLSFVGLLGAVLGWVLSFALSAILCAVIEILKNYSTNNFLQSAIQYKQFNKTLFGTMLFCCVVSVGTSFWGAKLLPSTTQPAPTKAIPAIENVDSLAKVFDIQLADIQSELEQTRKENTKITGLLNSNGRKSVPALQNAKTALETTKLAELNKARERNKEAIQTAENQYNTALEQYTTNNQKTGSLLGWVSLVLEIIYLACVLFSWLYFWNCYKERCALSNKQSIENEVVTIPTESVTETVIIPTETSKNENLNIKIEPTPTNETDKTGDTKTRPIGFFSDKKLPTETVILSTGNRICKHCQKPYIYGHAAQKYCNDACRAIAWEKRTGQKLQPKRKPKKTVKN